MDKVLNTIKESCDDLKAKNVIDEEQYNTCKALLNKQKWREDLGNTSQINSTINSFTQTHMNNYNRFKKIIDNSFDALQSSKNQSQFDMYVKRIQETDDKIKAILAEFKNNKPEMSGVFKEYVNKQAIVNTNNKTIKKQNNNIELINTKQNNISEQEQIENYRKMIYVLFMSLCLLMIIIISIVILYYGKYN